MKIMKILAALAAVTLLLQACGYQVPEPENHPLEGVNNSVKVGDLLIAGQPTQEALKQVAAAGYRTVISTRGAGEVSWDESAAVKELGMAFYQAPMGKPLVAITDDQLKQLSNALKNAERPILLHCGSGNRASALWAVWLAEEKDVAVAEALRLATLTGMTSMRALAEKRLGVSGQAK